MRRWFAGLLIILGMLPAGLPVQASSSADKTAALQAVKTMLTETYNAYKTLPATVKYTKMQGTDSTYRFKKYVESNIDHMKVHGLKYSKYSYALYSTKVTVTNGTARVNTYVNLDYSYAFAPKVKSGIYNMYWSVGLKKSGSTWQVSSLDIQGLNCFSSFRDKVDARKVGKYNYTKIVDDVVAVRKKQTRDIQKGLTGVKRGEKITDKAPQKGQVAYDRAKAVRYASIYSIRPAGNRLFNKMEEDCTNFVSCCLWAGYGGWKEGQAGNQALISSRYRMTSEWYGAVPGKTPSGSWMRVVELWSYLTAHKHDKGPTAQGYNNNGSYLKMNQRIQKGDIIQFYKYKKNRYAHSMFVSDATSDPYISNAARIMVCGHTGDTLNRSLVDFLFNYDGLYGEAPKTRLIVPQPSTF